jgi:hypothetical protein
VSGGNRKRKIELGISCESNEMKNRKSKDELIETQMDVAGAERTK